MRTSDQWMSKARAVAADSGSHQGERARQANASTTPVSSRSGTPTGTIESSTAASQRSACRTPPIHPVLGFVRKRLPASGHRRPQQTDRLGTHAVELAKVTFANRTELLESGVPRVSKSTARGRTESGGQVATERISN